MITDKPIAVGRFGRSHGLKGWLRINSETNPTANILNYQPWIVKIQGEYKTLFVTDSKIQNDTLLVHMKDINTPEDAKTLAGLDILIEREQLPDLSHSEFYWADIQGLDVVTIDNIKIGMVDYLIEAGACDVMVVKGDKEYLIPFDRKNVIKSIDLENRKIVVDWDLSL